MPQKLWLKVCLYTLSTVFVSSCPARAKDVEMVKKTIGNVLRQKNPAVVGEFNAFCQRYDRLVLTFFDTKNNESLATHVAYMEQELVMLDKVRHDARFASVQSYLDTYYGHIERLVYLLKEHIGSHKTFSLCLKIYKFKFLLPKDLKKRGNFSLLRALRHRLSCDT